MTPAEDAYVRARARVPEQIVCLMTLISRGEAFLSGDYLCFAGDRWLIVVGYPLEGSFSGEGCGHVVEKAVQTCRPEVLWFIGPELPSGLQENCTERKSDRYYLLDIERTAPKPSLLRAAERAGQALTVERERVFSLDHERLAAEFLRQADASPRIVALYRAMPGYIGRSPTGWTLSARDRKGRLCAFFVVELGAASFATYLLGARSRRHETPHASDLLFREMIALTRESGKGIINLGLGVNAGIRRFKEKWGGEPGWPYEFCEHRYAKDRKTTLLDAIWGRL
jgi:hypothetical protein